MVSRRSELGIWGYAFGYFACYVPYSALAKALSRGDLPGMRRGLSGLSLLPISSLASLFGMFAFVTAVGWWRFAGRRRVMGRSLPAPGLLTFLSGVCTAAIIATTTLAYTFDGVSIVFMMMLMRGGVLVIAPLTDFASGRSVRWFSWLALGLSMAALLVAFFGGSPSSLALTWIAAADVVVYLLGYFVRLRFMSRLAKSADPDLTRRYFVEEQMTATPLFVAVLAIAAVVGQGPVMLEIRRGFTEVWSSGQAGTIIAMGLLSQGTGVFGGLILLDRRENSFCVPVNRASSVLAGLAASVALAQLAQLELPGGAELVGAGLVVLAIVALSAPPLVKKRA